jgi:hypothetical protein
MEINSKDDLESVQDSTFDVGFNDYYELPSGEWVAVPGGSSVPSEWLLVAD